MGDQPILRAAWFVSAVFAAAYTWWAWPSMDVIVTGLGAVFFLYEGVFW